ncbi:hypothetical protein Tco_0433777, partial [Tanacetum coccineum]
MDKVQTTAEQNVSANDQQHAEQPEFNNEGGVDQDAEQPLEKCPLIDQLTKNRTNELLNQSLESKNICLKKTVAQFQKDFSKLEAHCINLELQSLKSGQHGQFLKEKSNKVKVTNDTKLEHTMANLLKENE